jgi:hypothetical protein
LAISDRFRSRNGGTSSARKGLANR